MLSIKGLQKTSLIDYPGKICSIIFLAECNFRCGFCHNPGLVLGPSKLETLREDEVIADLSQNKLIEAVCITGGEPTLQKELPEFIKKIKKAGLLVKLDTNGTNPAMLKKLIDEKLLDYIAMDIKAPPEKYCEATKSKVSNEAIQKSVDLIRNSCVDYEFRTTVVPTLFWEEDAEKIGKWLNGSKKYVLQQFTNKTELLDSSFGKIKPYSKEELQKFAGIIKPYFGSVEVRGI